MASTAKLGLYKPAGTENVNIDQLNSNFDLIDLSAGVLACTSATRPAGAFPGQVIFESDTGNLMWQNNAKWQPLSDTPNAANAAARDALYPVPVLGDRVFRKDLQYIEVYLTSWARIQAPAVPAQKAYMVSSTRSATDNYAPGNTMLQLTTTLVGAPAGKYHLTGRVILKSTQANGGAITYYVNGAQADQVTLDVGTLVVHVPIDLMITHNGGDLTCDIADNRSAGTATVYAGSRLTVAYMGTN